MLGTHSIFMLQQNFTWPTPSQHIRDTYIQRKKERARHKLPLILFPSLSLLLSHHFPTYFLPSALNPYTHTASFIESLKKLG